MLLPTRFIIIAALALPMFDARADLKAGDPFPSLTTAGLVGDLPVTDGKVLLVDFWASWCAPCKASFPAYAKLQAEYAPRGLVIVAVSVDENQAAYEKFVKSLHPPFVTVHDKTQQLVSMVKVPTMPTCYLVGPEGNVRFMHEGFHGEASEKELRKEIDGLLAESTHSR
jgi:thiol-disulfide isomerase/thioredoxin